MLGRMWHFSYLCNMKEFRNLPIDKLALQLAGRTNIDVAHVLRQVEGWQRLRHKVPSWAAIDNLAYPHRLALEQCSGEEAARYKAGVVQKLLHALPRHPLSMADLTGGLGVDFSFIARHFTRAIYVERQEALCKLAQHNFPLLQLKQAEVVCADGVDYLQHMEAVDLLFLDPARRDGTGRKTVLIEDCEPNVCALCSLLLEKASVVMLKLSTMLDIAGAIRSLGCVAQAHVVSVGGECKDLLLILARRELWADLNRCLTGEPSAGAEPLIVAHEDNSTLAFTSSDEAEAQPGYTAHVEAFLYEPGPAVLKAGAFKVVAQRWGLHKLHPNSHLYTSATAAPNFPGRTFCIDSVYGFGKADLRALRNIAPKANLTVRNFPSTVDALRKKLKLREGGNIYLFATTLADGSHVLLRCHKA